eukprot:augustus_masked-scaffold_49-processed-gene-1.16-mRNA-1 protein AED:1.00 eAED:1.00 QI:0/-1/0/0/-1/1/1/0/471
MKKEIVGALLGLSYLCEVKGFSLRKGLSEETFCEELMKLYENNDVTTTASATSAEDVRAMKDCLYLLEQEQSHKLVHVPRSLQRGGGDSDDDDDEDSDSDDDDDDDTQTLAVAAGAGVLALGSLLFVIKKRRRVCAPCFSTGKGKQSKSKEQEVKQLASSPVGNGYTVIPIPNVAVVDTKGEKRNSPPASSPSSSVMRPRSKLVQTQSKRDLLKKQKKLNRKMVVDKRSEISQVLSHITSLSFSTKTTSKRIPAKATSGKGGAFGRFTVATPYEQRIKFLSERISWKNYDTSLELNKIRQDVVDAIVNGLAKVTLQEEDMRLLKNSAYLDMYEGISVPNISINEYLFGLVDVLDQFHEETPYSQYHGNGVGIRCLVMAVIYINRVKEMEDNFFLSVFNQHRIFAICILLAAKITEDEPIENEDWADVSGLYLEDLNEVELEFCRAIKWDLLATEEDIDQIYRDFGLKKLVS